MTDKEARWEVIKKCDCDKCKANGICLFAYTHERLPNELFTNGMGLCPKIKNERW
jgi:hypothetical protein